MADRRELSAQLARRRLARRPEVRAAEETAIAEGVPALLVGGAVRDAFLERGGGDVDLAVPAGLAERFAHALARRLGTRAVPLGRPGTRVLKVPAPPGEVDVWEMEGSREEDLARRDFTVNALAFELPAWTFASPDGALADLAAARLRLPRPGVLLEDPLRVLRAARFRAELGFRLAPAALLELRRAAVRLPETAPERRLAEWDRILAVSPEAAAAAIAELERWGAFGPLVPGSTPAERRAGIRRVRRLPARAGASAGRVALLAPLGLSRALAVLDAWKAPRLEQRMAGRVLSLSSRPAGRSSSRAEVVRAARALAPFVAEGSAILSASSSAGERSLGEALARLRPASLERILRPPRLLATAEVAELAGVPAGPALGRALAALDEAVAEGRTRSPEGARRFVREHGRR